MKKFEITITTKQGKKQVTVHIDGKTAALLENCPPDVRQVYLEEAYKEKCQEIAETRRHISLEKSMANGHDFVSPTDTPIDTMIKAEETAYVKSVLDKLTDKQKEVFTLHSFDRWKFEKIAEKMGVSVQCVHQIYQAAIKKLKKFLQTP